MKTNKFWFVMAAAAVLAGMVTLVSCEKDEPFQPEVIESEVLDQGMDESIKVQSGTEGTSLSYESWILVKGITRAEFENRVSVTLNNQLKHISGELDVRDFNEGEAVLEFSNKAGESKKDGFVTVTDSILVCTVRYPDFSFDYELTYQVGVYDDGVTRMVMPHYQYENITDKGSTFSAVEKVSEGDKEYEKRTLTHELEVTLNGEVYTVFAEFVLYKGRADDILRSSKVINEGSKIISSTETSVTTLSFIEVEQEWSVSGVKSFRVETELVTKMTYSSEKCYGFVSSMWDHYHSPLRYVDTQDSVFISRRAEGNIEFTKVRKTQDVILSDAGEGEIKLAVTHTACDYEVPVYKDAILTYEMPYSQVMADNERVNDVTWEQAADGWRFLFYIRNNFYVGDPSMVCDGTDLNGDGIDDITGELVEWTWADAVKLSWTYSDYIYLAEPTVSTLGIR